MRIWAVLLPLVGLPGTSHAYTEAELQAAELQAADVEAATRYLASDTLFGRGYGSAGSQLAQTYLIDELSNHTPGLFSAEVGDAQYRQEFDGSGVNILGYIEGRQHPFQYILVGAHYDGLGNGRNGATDNAAGVAIVLGIAKAINALPYAPRRSIIIAFWDAEESGYRGSAAYAAEAAGFLPLHKAYVNYDIQGANLAPSLQQTSFAIGAESGGPVLQQMVADAIATQDLGIEQLTMQFGQDRSDHRNFYPQDVPSVFFSDGTAGCYHEHEDDENVVDFGKLAKQARVGFRLVVDLAESGSIPTPSPAGDVVYEDAVVVGSAYATLQADLALFASGTQITITVQNNQFAQRIADGPAAFDLGDETLTLFGAQTFLDTVMELECDGFIAVPEPGQSMQLAVLGCWLSIMVRVRERRPRIAS